jgi:hypothetical protein
VSGLVVESGCISVQGVRKRVVSTPRPSGGEFGVKSGNRVGKTEAFGALFGRSRGGHGEAEMATQGREKVAERCRERADAGSGPSRRRMVTGRLGRLAADQKAPRMVRPRAGIRRESREAAVSPIADCQPFASLTGVSPRPERATALRQLQQSSQGPRELPGQHEPDWRDSPDKGRVGNAARLAR